jgi:hypothetical protein
VGHGLTIQSDGLDGQCPYCLGDSEEILRPVSTVAAPEPNRVTALAGDDAIPVVLDLVNPL